MQALRSSSRFPQQTHSGKSSCQQSGTYRDVETASTEDDQHSSCESADAASSSKEVNEETKERIHTLTDLTEEEKDRIFKENRMKKVVDHYRDISEELHQATAAACLAQRKLWRERSSARREHRKPDPVYVQQYMQAEAAIEQLRVERHLHQCTVNVKKECPRRCQINDHLNDLIEEADNQPADFWRHSLKR